MFLNFDMFSLVDFHVFPLLIMKTHLTTPRSRSIAGDRGPMQSKWAVGFSATIFGECRPNFGRSSVKLRFATTLLLATAVRWWKIEFGFGFQFVQAWETCFWVQEMDESRRWCSFDTSKWRSNMIQQIYWLLHIHIIYILDLTICTQLSLIIML